MSNKLSKKELDLLIERMLNEEKDPSWDNWGTDKKIKKDKEFLDKVNSELQPKFTAPRIRNDKPQNLSTKDYRDTLTKISKLDDKPKNRNKDVKDTSKSIALGLKFSTSFKLGLINSGINAFIESDSGKSFIEDFNNSTTSHGIVTHAFYKKYKKKVFSGATYNDYIEEIKKIIISGKVFYGTKSEKHVAQDFGLRDTFTLKNAIKTLLSKRTDPAQRAIGFSKPQLEEYNVEQLKKLSIAQQAALIATYQPQVTIKYAESLKTKSPEIDFVYLQEPSFPEADGDTKKMTPQPFGQLDITYGDVSPKQGFKDIAHKGVRKFGITVDPSVIETVSSIPGNGMLEKISSISTFMNDIDNQINSGTIAEVSSYIRMAGFLAESVRQYEESAAGVLFEVFLALLGKGIVIGGESGATDVVTFSNGAPIYYSAKLISGPQFSQSDQEAIGLTAVIEEASKGDNPQGLIYIVGFKTNMSLKDLKTKGQEKPLDIISMGEAKKANSLSYAVFRLKKIEEGISISVIYDGKERIVPVPLSKTDSEGKVYFTRLFSEIVRSGYWFAHMPIIAVSEDDIKNSAEAFSAKITSSSNEALKSLKNAFQNLTKLDSLSQEHTAKSDRLKSVDEHMVYIDKIQKQYTGFKENYNTVIQHLDTSGEEQKLGEITENKNKKKSKKDLDKLIKEVILNKNK
jgi:hypothetical protein